MANLNKTTKQLLYTPLPQESKKRARSIEHSIYEIREAGFWLPQKANDPDTDILDVMVKNIKTGSKLMERPVEKPHQREHNLCAKGTDLSNEYILILLQPSNRDSLEILSISSDTIDNFESLLSLISEVCPRLVKLNISAADIKLRYLQRLGRETKHYSLKVLDVCATDSFLYVKELLLGIASLFPTLQELKVKGSTALLQEREQPPLSSVTTSIQSMTLLVTNEKGEIDMDELAMLLVALCPKLSLLDVEASRILIDEVIIHEGDVLLSSIRSLTITASNEISTEYLDVLNEKLCPHLTQKRTRRFSRDKISPELITSVKSGDHVKGIIDHHGGKLFIEKYGFDLSVPAGALDEKETLSLKVLKKFPKNVTLKEDDMLVSFGVELQPHGLKFHKPVTLTFPHCAVLGDQENVEVVLYWSSRNERLVRTEIGEDSDLATYSVGENEIRLHLKHFCNGFPAFTCTFSGKKQLAFAPFLPQQMPSGRKLVLHVHFYDKLKGVSFEDIEKLEERHGYSMVFTEELLDIKKSQILSISCMLDDEQMGDSKVNFKFKLMIKLYSSGSDVKNQNLS